MTTISTQGRTEHLRLLGALALTLLLAACEGTRSEHRTSAGSQGAAAPSASATASRKPAPTLPPALMETPPPPAGEGWKALFDGRSMAGWKAIDFGGHGDVSVTNGVMLIEMGAALSGAVWTNPVPTQNYEVAWDAMKIDGSDFFAALTMPFAASHFTFVTGGWGGGLVGISSLDSLDASENDTTKYMGFEKGRWYRFRVRVTPARIQAWIDEERIVNVEVAERVLSMRPGDIDLCTPLGIATWQTTGAIRGVWIRPVTPGAASGASSYRSGNRPSAAG